VVVADAAGGGQALRLRLPSGAEIPAPPRAAGRPIAPGESVRCAIRPEKLCLAALQDQDGPGFPVTVEDHVYQGASTTWIVRDRAGARFVVTDFNREPDRAPGATIGRRAGDAAYLCWDPRYTILLPER